MPVPLYIGGDHYNHRFMQANFLYRAIFLLFILNAGTAARAQSKIDSLLFTYHRYDPQEKVFIHFDKTLYNPGETIWFKAYLFDGLDRAAQSKNFYAELRDENGVLLDKKTAPIIFSGAASEFELPANYARPTVYVRAYTVAMLNGDTDFIYTKPIRIIQPPKKAAASKNAGIELALLPEGGDMVAGLSSMLAFKAATPQGIPVHVKGYVKAADGSKLAEFSSIHNGMGTFNLLPEADASYTAVWKDENQKEHSTPLPAVKKTGITLHVREKVEVMGAPSAGKQFSIQRQEEAPDELKNLTIVGIMNRQLVYEARINLVAKTSVTATLPTAELPTGILQLTVFDSNMKPQAERICFVNNSGYEFDADAWLSEFNPEKRSLNRAEVKIADTVLANLSLAITDADLDGAIANDDNIVSHILLTGDLRGKIYQPYYYFYSTSDSIPLQLDLVMLTHGWRRYDWDRLLKGAKPPVQYIEPNFLSIKGKVVGAMGANYVDGLELNGFLRTTDSASTFISLPIDRNGNVEKDAFIFYDSAKLFLNFNDKNKLFEPSMFNASNGLLQGNIEKGLKYGLAQNPPEVDSTLAALNYRNNTEVLKIASKQYKDAHELANVTVTAKAKSNIEKLDQQYAKGMFSGGNATSFDVESDPFAASSMSVFQYLQGKVAGLQINTVGAQPSMSWRGGTPGLFLDEMQSDVQMMSGVNMSDVAYIKVFNPGSSAIFSNGSGGVIAVYTKRGGGANQVESKLGVVRLNGYSAIKQFYAPDYATPTGDELYENRRTTLFWEPFIILDKTRRRFKIQFFNNDISKRFRIVLEGINAEGKLIHVEKLAEK